MADAAQPKDAGSGSSKVNLRFDRARLKLSGWAARRDPAEASEAVHLQLEAGQVMLGRLLRDKPRPDVEKHVGYSGVPFGFLAVDNGLRALARLTGLDDLAVVVADGKGQTGRYSLPMDEGSAVAVAPLGSRQGVNKTLRLADGWMESGHGLSLRFDGSNDASSSVTAYQVVSGKLIKLNSGQAIQGLTTIVTLLLANPLAPVLLLFENANNGIELIDVIPFPSLLRGGLHAAERLILGASGDDLSEVASLSSDLMQAWLQRLDHPDRSVRHIDLDPAVHTGLEPGLNVALLSWLGECFQIAVRPLNGQPDAFIGEKLSAPRTAETLGHRLQLPADSIPTISAIVRTLPTGAQSQAVAGGMGLVAPGRNGPVWSVWHPAFVADFAGHAEGVRSRAPILRVEGEGAAKTDKGGTKELSFAWPLCLAFAEPPTRVQHTGPFERSSDDPTEADQVASDQVRAVSVLVLADAERSLLPLLESLVRQESVDVTQIVICRPEGEDDRSLEKALQRLFPDRHSVQPVAAQAGRLEQIVAARELLQSDLVLVVSGSTILPDKRVVAKLLSSADLPRVASVGCIVRAASEKMTPLSAGYSLDQLNLRTGPSLRFAPIDPRIWSGPVVVPVVANTLAALIVKRAALSNVSASGSNWLRSEVDDLLLGLQLQDAGEINLCTTAASVYSTAAGPRPAQLAVSLPYRISPEQVARIAESSTLVQRVT
jgi:hypothetical protein